MDTPRLCAPCPIRPRGPGGAKRLHNKPCDSLHLQCCSIAYSAAVTGSVLSGAVDPWVKDVRGSGQGKPIVQNTNPRCVSDCSRDGLVWKEIDPHTGSDLWYLRVDGGAEEKTKPAPLTRTRFSESFGQVSPDGSWIAYLSDESGSREVYVNSFPQLAGQSKVSESQGTTQTQQPRCNRNGKELFCLTRAAGSYSLMAAQVTDALPGATASLSNTSTGG
jgi:hypothetical protein